MISTIYSGLRRGFGPRACRNSLTVAALALLLPATVAAQDSAAVERSTNSGVYTAEQATIGKELYMGVCSSCHSPEEHSSKIFMLDWGNKPLLDLFGYVWETMPKDNPATLTPKEYAQVMAYILQLNKMPAGTAELPSDSASLGKIRFDSLNAAGVKVDTLFDSRVTAALSWITGNFARRSVSRLPQPRVALQSGVGILNRMRGFSNH